MRSWEAVALILGLVWSIEFVFVCALLGNFWLEAVKARNNTIFHRVPAEDDDEGFATGRS